MVELLFGLLVAGAKLAASSAVGEFAKGAGKSAFELLKSRLSDEHGVKSLALLEDAAENSSYEQAIKADLSKPEIAKDVDLLKLAERLRDAIEALPADVQSFYAVDIESIRSGGNILFDAIEGVKIDTVDGDGDVTFQNIQAPPGKP